MYCSERAEQFVTTYVIDSVHRHSVKQTQLLGVSRTLPSQRRGHQHASIPNDGPTRFKHQRDVIVTWRHEHVSKAARQVNWRGSDWLKVGMTG